MSSAVNLWILILIPVPTPYLLFNEDILSAFRKWNPHPLIDFFDFSMNTSGALDIYICEHGRRRPLFTNPPKLKHMWGPVDTF